MLLVIANGQLEKIPVLVHPGLHPLALPLAGRLLPSPHPSQRHQGYICRFLPAALSAIIVRHGDVFAKPSVQSA